MRLKIARFLQKWPLMSRIERAVSKCRYFMILKSNFFRQISPLCFTCDNFHGCLILPLFSNTKFAYCCQEATSATNSWKFRNFGNRQMACRPCSWGYIPPFSSFRVLPSFSPHKVDKSLRKLEKWIRRSKSLNIYVSIENYFLSTIYRWYNFSSISSSHWGNLHLNGLNPSHPYLW